MRGPRPRRPTPPLTPVGARNSPNTSRSAPAHSPVVPPAWARAMVASMMLPSGPSSAATRRSSSSARAHGRRRRASVRQRSRSAICSASTRWSTLRMFSISPSPSSGEGAVSVKQLTPTTICSPVSIRRTRSAWLRTRRRLSSSMASKAPPERLHVGQLGRGGLDQLGRLGLDHHRALEDVAVLEQVGLEGEHLLHAQRPLLVPGPGQARAPRSRPAAAWPGPGRSSTASRRGSRGRCAARCSPAAARSARGS